MEKIYYGDETGRHEAKGETLEQILKDCAEQIERDLLLEAEQTKKQADRDSAMAKLKKLGLTDDEIDALI